MPATRWLETSPTAPSAPAFSQGDWIKPAVLSCPGAMSPAVKGESLLAQPTTAPKSGCTPGSQPCTPCLSFPGKLWVLEISFYWHWPLCIAIQSPLYIKTQAQESVHHFLTEQSLRPPDSHNVFQGSDHFTWKSYSPAISTAYPGLPEKLIKHLKNESMTYTQWMGTHTNEGRLMFLMTAISAAVKKKWFIIKNVKILHNS